MGSFVKDKLNEHRNNPKQFWREINDLLPDLKSKKNISLVSNQTGEMLSPDKVAGEINDYFTNIGPKLSQDNTTIWEPILHRLQDCSNSIHPEVYQANEHNNTSE